MALLSVSRLALIAALALSSAAGRSAGAQGPSAALEYSVKAAYLLNFTRYVEWPDSMVDTAGRQPVVLCVYGSDPFGTILERTVDGRTSKGRPLTIRRLERSGQANGCHAVFISEEEWRRRPAVLESLARRGVLTVGEGEAFAEAGGVISFVIVNDAVRFVINMPAGEGAGLRLSSRLLAIATRLIGKEP